MCVQGRDREPSSPKLEAWFITITFGFGVRRCARPVTHLVKHMRVYSLSERNK